MIQAIRKWIQARRENRRLIAVARNAFLARYPDRHLVPRGVPPQRLPDGDHVVTVCWDTTLPPHRSWWRIGADTESVEELTLAEAQTLIQIPAWR